MAQEDYPYAFSTLLNIKMLHSSVFTLNDIFFFKNKFKLPAFYDNHNPIDFDTNIFDNINLDEENLIKFIIDTCRVIKNNSEYTLFIKKYSTDDNTLRYDIADYKLMNKKIKYIKYIDGECKICNKKFIDVIKENKKFILCEKYQYIPYSNIDDFKKIFDQNILNTFTGFIPKLTDKVNEKLMKSVLNYIKYVWCSKYDEIYEYILNWLAHICQKPNIKTGVAILLFGEKSHDIKSILCKLIVKQIIGEMNYSNHNSLEYDNIKDGILCCSHIKNNRDSEILREYITKDKLVVTIDGEDTELYDYNNFIISTTDIIAEKIKLSKHIFMSLDVTIDNSNDYPLKNINYRTARNFYNFLMQRDIKNFDPKKLPKINMLNNMKMRNIEKPIAFLIDILDDKFEPTTELRNELLSKNITFKLPNKISSKDLLKLYNLWRIFQCKLKEELI